MVPLQKFSVIRNRNFSSQNRDISLLWINFFNTRKKWNTKGFTYEIFGTVRHKKSAENRAPPPLWLIIVIFHSCKKTFVTRIFVIQRRVPYEVFQEMRQKVNRRTIVISPPPPLCIKPSGTRDSLKRRKVPHEVFRYSETRTFPWRVLHKIFGTVRQKQSTKSWYPYYPTNSETRSFLKHRRVHSRWFLAMWDKKNRKKVIALLSKNFWYQNISETQKGRPRCFSAIWDQKTSTENRDTPFLFIKFFRTGTFQKDESVPKLIFRYCEIESFPRKIVKLHYFA